MLQQKYVVGVIAHKDEENERGEGECISMTSRMTFIEVYWFCNAQGMLQSVFVPSQACFLFQVSTLYRHVIRGGYSGHRQRYARMLAARFQT